MTDPRSDPRSDRQADLLADLQSAATARTLPSGPPPVAAGPAVTAPTPVLAVQLTPLRWALPRLRTTGLGLRLRVGPLEVAVTLG